LNKILKNSSDNLQYSSSNPKSSLESFSTGTLFPLELPAIENKKIFIDFDGGHISSDAGLLMLKEVEKNVGIIKALGCALDDKRDVRYIDHTYSEIFSQRIYQIASGYEDCNDCTSLRDDPILKMCSERLPLSGKPLASQPTMSRFENTPSRSDLYKMAVAFVDSFVASYSEEPKSIVLDFDDTDTITYGDQQMSLFNGYYGDYCLMPLHIYEGLSGKYILTILKPSRLTGKAILSILKRLVKRLRTKFKNTIIIFRADSHFAAPEVMQWANSQKNIIFVTGLTGNKVLDKRIETVVNLVIKEYAAKQVKVKQYFSFYYKAESWTAEQRVIAKVEMTDQSTKPNVRFIVTNAIHAKAKKMYEKVYCARGNAELYIKDHKTYLHSDRASCHRFEANQFRLFLHSAAYVLLHALKHSVLKGTIFAQATMKTLQLKLLKIGVRVRELKTKIKLEFPTSCPYQNIIGNAFALFAVLRL